MRLLGCSPLVAREGLGYTSEGNKGVKTHKCMEVHAQGWHVGEWKLSHGMMGEEEVVGRAAGSNDVAQEGRTVLNS